MNIKSFFQSINLRGNKIINAKVDSPTHAKHPTSKEYVDGKLSYNTPKSNQFTSGSPKFPWLNFNLSGKSFSDLFDDLFFPIVNPVYDEAKIDYVKFDIKYHDVYGDVLVHENGITFSVNYNIIAGDRILNSNPKIVVTKNDLSVQEFVAITPNLINAITCGFALINVKSIELVVNFSTITTIKNDNYGTPYLPAPFNSPLVLKYDVLKDILNKYEIIKPIIFNRYSNINSAEFIVNAINNDDRFSPPISSSLDELTVAQGYVTGNDPNFYVFGVPNTVYNNFKMGLVFDETLAPLKRYIYLDFSITQNRTIKTIEYYGNYDDYLFFIIDLGHHESTKTFNIHLERIKHY